MDSGNDQKDTTAWARKLILLSLLLLFSTVFALKSSIYSFKHMKIKIHI